MQINLIGKLIGTVATFQLLIPTLAQATTLTQAVNNQLATISTPCQTLLGGDSPSVLTGGLYNSNLDGICQRAFPAGSSPTPQETNLGASNSSAITGNTLALLKQTQQKQHINNKEKIETQIGEKWSLFLTATGGNLNRDVSSDENGYKSRVFNLLGGSTYAVNANNTLGAALAMQRRTGDYTDGGNFKDTVTGIRLLETYNPTTKYFLQVVAGFDSVSSQRTRNTSFYEYDANSGGLLFSRFGAPYADHSYSHTELSLLNGYTMPFGSISLTPQLGLTWLKDNYGTYNETGSSGLALKFHNDQRKSLQSAIGLQVTNAISTHFGVVLPQFDLRWKHEFQDKSRQVNVSFVDDTRSKIFSYDTAAADRDYFEISAGSSFVYAHGVQSFVRLQSVLGQQYYHNTTLALGLNIAL